MSESNNIRPITAPAVKGRRGRPRKHAPLHQRLLIPELLASRGKTMSELYAFVGAGERAVARWIAGDEQPSDDSLRRLMDFFQCDRLDLVPGPDPHLRPDTQEFLAAYKQLAEPAAEALRRAVGLPPRKP
ncbi:MAG TPA: helix-turn-helix transcriptional regulator [Stellaceae bacterium]|nr:helix-turn-helix transcriptional regulator [Stellaceae bacterium]